MALTQLDNTILRNACSQYDYPPQVYDTAQRRIVLLQGMNAVEEYIGQRLRSGDPGATREGLASVLSWGHGNVGYQIMRVEKFLCSVTDMQVARAASLLGAVATTGTTGGTLLYAMSKIGMPELSRLVFLSKVVMFLDPEQFPILDNKIADLLGTLPPDHRLAGFTRHPTYIPLTRHNAAFYDKWSVACRQIASSGQIGEGRAVDAERAFFYLVGKGQIGTASEILARWA
jgi:hypothetical protein